MMAFVGALLRVARIYTTNVSPQRPFLGYYAPRFLTWELCVPS